MTTILGEGFVEEVRLLLHVDICEYDATMEERAQAYADELHDNGHAATIRSDPTGGTGAVFAALEILWHGTPEYRDTIQNDFGWSP